MIRVAYLSADGFEARGGIGRVGAYLGRAFEAADDGVCLVDQPTRLTGTPFLKHLSVPLALAQFGWRCRTERIDIAHINVARKGSTWRKLLFATLARKMGVPVLLHLHGSGYDGYFAALPGTAQQRIRRFFGQADAVVALSPFWEQVLVETIHVPAGKVHVIPNGVTLPPERPETDAGDAVRCIAFLGLIGERKGVDVLIAALAALPEDAPPWRAVIGGNGEIEWARAHAVRAGVADRIDFPGWLDEQGAAALLRRADIFVLPSRAENQPVAILEAMAHGLPVVGSNVGAIPTQIEDGKTGLLVPSGDAPALSGAIASLLNATERCKAMGRAGRMRVATHYALEESARRFVTLYRQMMRDR